MRRFQSDSDWRCRRRSERAQIGRVSSGGGVPNVLILSHHRSRFTRPTFRLVGGADLADDVADDHGCRCSEKRAYVSLVRRTAAAPRPALDAGEAGHMRSPRLRAHQPAADALLAVRFVCGRVSSLRGDASDSRRTPGPSADSRRTSDPSGRQRICIRCSAPPSARRGRPPEHG